jgi:hypothetical protein
MNTTLSGHSFRRLVNSLVRPTETAETGPNYWPYPLPEAEIVAWYGLRCLTQAAQQLFPGLRLTLNISKVCLTRPPVVTPAARAGWVVWTAETYPGHYLVRMPGGVTLPAPFNQMLWTAVSEESDDIPATTVADVKADKWRQQWRTAVRQNIHSHLRI